MSHRELKVWHKSRELVKLVYGVSKRFPASELYGLCSQIQRAAVSVPSNVAEGYARNTTKDYMRFISMACGSLAEVETQLLLAVDLGYVSQSDCQETFDATLETERMLKSLYTALSKKTP